ncbi:MAG: hypothetical protein FWE57_12210, partial [Chitinispirillia bacterium]|nr:hypothetical protein [Chitinispirillia bacterium]
MQCDDENRKKNADGSCDVDCNEGYELGAGGKCEIIVVGCADQNRLPGDVPGTCGLCAEGYREEGEECVEDNTAGVLIRDRVIPQRAWLYQSPQQLLTKASNGA